VGIDRDEMLVRTDLAQLCDQLLGERKGRGIWGTWPCPAPGHGPQTGRTPPVGVFRTREGQQRWRCHGCGSGGTAIDLVMQRQGVGFVQALEYLGRQTGVADTPWQPPGRRRRPAGSRPAAPGGASPGIERYVAACESWLWSPAGRVQRDWLRRRGLGDDVLRANRIGADPGPRRMARLPGLPRGGMAVVLPVLDASGKAAYCQARYLGQRPRRFDNPTTALAPASPGYAPIRTPGPWRRPDVVVVCEGVFDALSAAQAGNRAVAVLSAAAPEPGLASRLIERFASERLVVAFDGDSAGRRGGQRLGELLDAAGAGGRVALLEVTTDLNDWLVRRGPAFPTELAAAVDAAVPPLAAGLRPTPPLVRAASVRGLDLS